MIKNIYAHLTKEDEAKQVVKEMKRVEGDGNTDVAETKNVNNSNEDDETIAEYQQRIRHEISVVLARIEKNNHPFYSSAYLGNFPRSEEYDIILNAQGGNIIETINARLEKYNLQVNENYKIVKL